MYICRHYYHGNDLTNVYWKLHVLIGEPILWVEECRIRHLPTRRYLAVTGAAPDYKVFHLKTDKYNLNVDHSRLL